MKRILIVVAVAIFVSCSVASAQNQGSPLICTDTLTGSTNQPLIINESVFVPDGHTCFMMNVVVYGNLQAGTLSRENSQGGGPGAVGGAFLLMNHVTVHGNVEVGPGSGFFLNDVHLPPIDFTNEINDGNPITLIDAVGAIVGSDVTNLIATGGTTAIFASTVRMNCRFNGGAAGVANGGTTVGGINSCLTGTLDNLDFLQAAFDKGTGNGTGTSGGGNKLTCGQALGYAEVTVAVVGLLSSFHNGTTLGAFMTGVATGLVQGTCGSPSTTPGF